MRLVITITITILFVKLFGIHAQDLEKKISGLVMDSAEREALPGAALIITGKNTGTVSDENGYFQLFSRDSIIELQVRYLGYEPFFKKLELKRDTSLNIYMNASTFQSDEAVITAEEKVTATTEIGKVKLLQKNIELIPALGGERDVLKTLMLTPGIQSVSEGSSGLYVRGGNAGQNLIMLDEMPLYNPNHLLGFFPVFHAPVIQSVEIAKGIDDAETGGRLSSVVQVNMKDGDRVETGGEANVGLLSSSFTLSGPIRDNTSYLLSARKTYLSFLQDLVLKKVMDSKFIQNTRYSFHDFYGKVNHQFSNNDRIKLTFYGGFDDYKLQNTSIEFQNKMNWHNLATAISWTHSFKNGFYNQLSAGYSAYQHGLKADFNDYEFALGSEIRDYFVKTTFSNNTFNNHFIKFGVSYIRHWNKPGEIKAQALTIDYNRKDVYHSNEISAFFNDEVKIGSKLSFSAGLRYNWYSHVGPYMMREQESVQSFDTLTYNRGDIIYSHHSLEPRFVANYKLNNNQSLKAGFAKISQSIHLIPVGGVSLPADIWFSSTAFAPPAESWQYSLGYFRDLNVLSLEFSAEIYHKQMMNLIDRKKSILNNFDEANLGESFANGKGQSTGLELYLAKTNGNFNGWISYTLSKSTRKFAELNNGELFVSKYDRPHDLSVVVNYQFNEKWSVSGIFVYATGNAMTMPVGRYMIQGVVMNDYTKVNGFRLPDYHRMDISFNRVEKTRWGEYIWNFSIYNVYNRSNPYYLFFDVEATIEEYYLKVEPKSVSLYPVLPSISLIVKF